MRSAEVLIRDSKTSNTIAVSRESWRNFLRAVASDEIVDHR
jgi:hypothetical protein